eukprot:2646285-Prymnesium_polylepis.1
MQRWEVGAQLTLDFFGDNLKKHPLRVKSIEPDDAVEQVCRGAAHTRPPRPHSSTAHPSRTRHPHARALRAHSRHHWELPPNGVCAPLSTPRSQIATTQHSTIVQVVVWLEPTRLAIASRRSRSTRCATLWPA